jgi:hypothetical protein
VSWGRDDRPEIELADVACPWCGEVVEIALEADLEGEWVQDCEVCCRPWKVTRDDWGLRVDRE